MKYSISIHLDRILKHNKKGYSQTYLKSINNKKAALFNYAVRYYDLRDNP